MSIESFNANIPEQKPQSRFTKVIRSVLTAGALFGAVGCNKTDTKASPENHQKDNIEAKAQMITPDATALKEYYANLKEGNFPSDGQDERIKARAIEIALSRGITPQENSVIEVESKGTVPTSIKIDGAIVPLNLGDYNADESKFVNMIQGMTGVKTENDLNSNGPEKNTSEQETHTSSDIGKF